MTGGKEREGQVRGEWEESGGERKGRREGKREEGGWRFGVGPDRYMTISEHRAYRFGTSVQTTAVHVNDHFGT